MILQEVFAPVDEIKPLSKEQMDEMDKARDSDDFVLPELEKPEPGLFAGIGEASWKGVASGALKSASAFDTALSSTGMVRAALQNAEVETGYAFEDIDQRTSAIENRLNQDSKELRRRAKEDYGVDPTTMGTAAQIVYGVAETIPKAIGYSVLAGPAGGSVLFGADLGISRTQELMDEGVDKNTAINAGLVTFAAGSLGMRLPATFGRSRIASATIGAVANMGLTAAELQGVNWVLQNQNYNELAEKYQLNVIDMATSGIFGGVLGGVMWRPSATASVAQNAAARRAPLRDRIYNSLRRASPENISDDAIRVQADLHAAGIQVMADRAQIDADSIAPEIVRSEASEGFSQPMTQGREWHMGVAKLMPEDELEVLSYEPSNFSRDQSIDAVRVSLSNGVQNQDTGFVLTASSSDIKKSVGARGSDKEKVFNYVAPHITEIAQKARLLESHADIQHKNKKVQGIHIFGQPVLFGDALYRVQLIVRDYVIPNQERTAVHSIDGIEIERIENPPPETAQLEGGSSAIESSAFSVKTDGLPAVPDNLKITVSRFLSDGNRPYIRSDGRGFFDPIDEGSYSENGVYFEGGFNQRVVSPDTDKRLITVHNISQDNLLKANQLGGLAVPSLGITRADSAYSDFGDITLIGTRGMADPANGTPVFSMDAYTNRFPEARWEKSVNRDNARAFMREYSTWEEKFGVDDGSVSYYLEREPNRDRFLREFANSTVTKRAFLETKGVTVEPEYVVQIKPSRIFKELESDFRLILNDVDDVENWQRRLSEAYANAVDRLEGNVPSFMKRRAERVRDGEVLSWDFLGRYMDAVTRPANNGAPQIDRKATEKKINAEIDKYQSEYADWIQEKTKDLFGEPTIRVGNRNLPMTLENVVKAMTRRSARNTERTLTFGPGNVRAAASKRFRSLSDIQRNRDRITDTDTVNSINKEIDDLFADFRNSVVDYYKWGGSFEKFDDAMRALADTAKGNPTKDKLRTALNKNGFNASEVPDEVLETGVNALVQLRRGMTDYFEAKPQRAVYFDEFVGAAVPEDVSPEVVSILENNGIRVQRYRADNRSDVVNRLSRQLNQERGDVLYQQNRGSFNPDLNRITLTANANISTYSHEMGHWYLENLFQLSRRAVAENTLKEDANILLKEFGIKSVDDWDNLGVDGQRKYQEQFASWVEIYLSEGRAPKPTLQRVFERLGQWLVDLYRELGGVKKAVGDTYKAEVGEELPPVSEEVGKVLDRLFDQDRKVRKASQVSKAQVAAARMVQANRTNNNKLEEIIAMPNGKEKTRALRDLEKSTKAQLKAIQAMKRGLPVDVSQDVEQMNVDVDHLVEMKGNFGRAYVMGNNDSAVILQNRDRSDVSSQGQMNAIAANPQYGLVSVSRSYSGAPVVSYGTLPDVAHLGATDFIFESNGNRVPFIYAVVEADDVETSNLISGSTNENYGSPDCMNAVIGNGRMTALREAYRRGTADIYRQEMEADSAHGIDSAVIKQMKNPVLIRVMNPEDVTTGLISRSNSEQVLARDAVEVAFEDAPKIRARAGLYEFDDKGNPTQETTRMFIQDLGDVNALGRLITSDGRPTPQAVERIKNAVFFEAYQSPELSELYSLETDPGIRRILNGMAMIAPRLIKLREQAQQLDFSQMLVEAANRIRQARLNPKEGEDFANQTSFLDNPAATAFVEFLDDNDNSAVAIARVLNPLIDWARNAAQAADGGLFGGDAEVHVDLADVVGQLRNIINDQRAGAGLEPLPEIDVNALRDQIQTTVDTVAQAVDEVNAHIEAETQQAEVDIANEAQALDAQRQQSLAVLDEKTSVDARAQFLMDQNPDQVYRVLNENGMEVEGTLSDLLAQADEEIRQAEVEASGIGRAVECVLRNGGIQ